MIQVALVLPGVALIIVATAFVCRHFFLLGFQLGRDDKALDPGETTGSLEAVAEATEVLPAVGESSGRHALPEWPASGDTERFEAVTT